MKQKIIVNTLMFIFMLLFISFFQNVFGVSNKMVGITVLIFGLGICEKDLTYNLGLLVIRLLCFLLAMGIFSYLSLLNPILGLILNFGFIFYATYVMVEGNKKPYHFPFILGYLFLIFLSPSAPTDLPGRLIALIGGAFLIVGLQWLFNHKTYDKVLNSRLDQVLNQLIHRLERLLAKDSGSCEEEVHALKASMGRFMKAIYERFGTNGSFNKEGVEQVTHMVAYEKMYYLLDEVAKDYEAGLIDDETIEDLIVFVKEHRGGHHAYSGVSMFDQGATSVKELKQVLLVLQTAERDEYSHDQRTLWEQFLKPIDRESYAFKFAMRLSILLSVCLFISQLFGLSYGRWLCFTIAALVQPDAESSHKKTIERLIGTGVGATIFVALITIFKEESQQMIIVLLSSYIGMYMNRYDFKMIFITIQALGGALLTATGSIVIGNRLFYIVVGAVIAYLGNKWLFPIRRKDIKEHYIDLYEQQKNHLIKTPQNNPHEAIVDAYHYLEMGKLEDEKYSEWLDVSFEALVRAQS